MKRALVVTIAVVAVAGAAAGIAAAFGVSIGGGTSLLAQRGFGDSANSYSWSMAWFKGKLYVGTARHELCVENVTVDFYLVVSQRYRTNPLPGVQCPRNPYDMDLRAEIWQYTPGSGRWRMVYRSPVVRNPRARGKKVARDIAYRGMTVYQGRLYAGDVTADEYIPELKRKYPPRLLYTSDGVHFGQVPARNVVETTPHGVSRPMGFRVLTVWRNQLYATLTPGLTGDGAVFEVTNTTGRRPRFRQVSPGNLAVFEAQPFNGGLYLGTGDRDTGYGVWRLGASRVRHGRHARTRYRLTPVVTNGAGRGAGITSVVSMHVFHDWLYVGSSGWYNKHYQPNSELIRINRSGHWEVVAGITRRIDGQQDAPISGLGDGFYNDFSAHFWRMEDFHGALYIGTNDWSWLVQKAFPGLEPSYLPGIIQSALASEYGFDLWASCNGRDWFPVTRDAFSGNEYDFGARNLVSTPAGMFVGSANQAQGTKVWDVKVSPCQSLVRSAAVGGSSAPATPQAVLTDSQPSGNVVSWRAVAGATSYDVLRSSPVSVPLNLGKPPVMPDGFALDQQVPNIVAPGTPGASQLDLQLPQNFVGLAATRSTAFVDQTAKPGERYLYQVVAVGPSGAQSQPSAVQAAPDARPPATFEQVQQALGTTGAANGLERAFLEQQKNGDRAGEVRTLDQLEQQVGADSDAGVLIERLARQTQYAGLAGGNAGP